MLEKVRNTIKKYNLIDKNDTVVVAVSGGPDSVALLFILNLLKEELKCKVHVAHLDHMLRKTSYKDREFVERLAQKLRLPVSAAKINVKGLARRGSLEEVARKARLEFLFGVAKKIKAHKIALGHTQDDQAETVLMRIIRGAGLYGLTGILPKRKISGHYVIRPLIEMNRKAIEKFLKKRRIPCRIDETNSEDIYFRNKIRNRLLPLLEKEYNKNIKEVLSHTAESLGYDYDYLTRSAEKITKNLGTRINLDKLLKLHPAMQRLVLRAHIARVKGDTRRIAFQHIKEIEDLILNRPVNSVVDLPKGVSVIKKKTSLFFYRRHAVAVRQYGGTRMSRLSKLWGNSTANCIDKYTYR